jgi:hypothetical protein
VLTGGTIAVWTVGTLAGAIWAPAGAAAITPPKSNIILTRRMAASRMALRALRSLNRSQNNSNDAQVCGYMFFLHFCRPIPIATAARRADSINQAPVTRTRYEPTGLYFLNLKAFRLMVWGTTLATASVG